MYNVRETSWRIIVVFLIVQMVLVTVLIKYYHPFFVSISKWTHWIIHPDLLFATILVLLIIVGIIFIIGRLRPADVGLTTYQIPAALHVTAIFWIVTQIFLIIVSVFYTGTVELHPNWTNPGVIASLGFFVAMLIGMALYEEVAFRGFLFRQIYIKFQGSHRTMLSALISSVLFAVTHIPTRLINAQMELDALMFQMVVLTFAGLFGVLLYIRTKNLFMVIGIHALVNAPTQLFQSNISPFVLTVTLSVALWWIWPKLQLKFPVLFHHEDLKIVVR